MKHTGAFRFSIIAVSIALLDQLTKRLVVYGLSPTDEKTIIDGFLKLVHWGNTGAAWSMFHGNNEFLAILSLAALLGLILGRRHFAIHTTLGQIAFGCVLGGIIGNMIDRLFVHHVIDFLRFYLYQRGGEEIGFPAFNVADIAICTGVGLLFLLSWQREGKSSEAIESP